jgi:transcription-repair coupling factor (superfamily II helicase)
MILPFVRELLTDLEHCEPFERVRRHLALAAGRKRVSGLTATARALYLPLFARAAQSPVVVIVADNKAADTLQLTLRAACELTGAIEAERVLRCRPTMFCPLKICRLTRTCRSSALPCCGRSRPAPLRS